MTIARFFLVAPEAADFRQAALSACAAGDCASILVGNTTDAETVRALQAVGLAVIIKDCEPRQVHHLKADGLHIARAEPVKDLRQILKREIIGVFSATSRHIAMEAAESGADYVAFAQKSPTRGEPLIGWWQAIFEVPVVAFDPVTPEDLATLLPQKPDFIRPSDAMWESPQRAAEVISALQAKLK